MCGIVGHITVKGSIDRVIFDRMRDTLSHRGPDDADSILFDDDHIALGHRRLSFLDLSANGRQPMCNEDGNIWIVLNGEIYNYIELRETLIQKGHTFKTHSDTEVIIHGYEEWGKGVIDRLKGMFAFGILDLTAHRLLLVRDRFGIKPLYYTHDSDGLIFASELKAILASPSVKREMDMSSFADYFIYRYIPSPKTIWKNISKLPPAHYLDYDYRLGKTDIQEYWKISAAETPVDDAALIRDMGAMIRESVSMHARSDVPIGSFLSGGYDSSAIVYYMTTLGYRPDTFSIGFKDWDHSEHKYAEIVANHLSVPITSVIADEDTLSLLPIMPLVYDEPIADISILPTWMVSHAAAKQVKAVMSGEGADELFGGYSWQKKFFAQHAQRPFWRKIFKSAASEASETISFYADAMSMGRFDRGELQQMMHSDHHATIPDDADWFYRQHMDMSLSPLKRIQKMDIKCFMGELVLTKIDRASMASSLEVRVPFVDHELFEKIFSVAEQDYYKADKTKYILYENIKGHLPDQILHRAKQGFVGPDIFYMNLKWYSQILDRSTLIADGIVRKEYYIQLMTNKDHWRLWKLTVMEQWYRYWIKGDSN